ncbi:Ig-like domain-containing protein [Bordetella trematum]|uniref:Ig-like domain-containing protein n=1 Tax=Bordetella trematum TaxID=123899 RepID=UPI003AF38DCE
MNQGIHRVIWSGTRNAWVVATDLARGRGKQKRRQRVRCRLLSSTLCVTLAAQSAAPLVVLAQGAPVSAGSGAQDSAAARQATEALGQRALWEFAAQVQAAARYQAGAGRGSGVVDAAYLRQQVQGQANQVLQNTVQLARDSGLPFLRNLSGDLYYDFNTDRSSFKLNTIDSVYRQGADIGLLQIGLHNHNDRITSNLGAIYRREVTPQLLVGSNAFLDYEYAKQHWRASLGVEAIAPEFSWFANLYLPLSGWKAAKRAERRQERPAAGFDLGLQWRPQWSPGMDISARYFQWQGAQLDYFDNGRTQARANGVKLGLQYRPVPLFSIGVHHTRLIDGQSQTSVMLGVQLNLTQPLRKQLTRSEETPAFDLNSVRYNLVEREHRIVLKTRRQLVVLPLSVIRLVTDPGTGRITLSGMTEPQAVVHWTLPDGSTGQAVANAAGMFRFESPRDLPSGVIVLQAFNRHGDRSPELRHPYQDAASVAPLAVVITKLRADPSNGTLMLEGATEPNLDVWVRFPAEEPTLVRSDSHGAFIAGSRNQVQHGAVAVLAIDKDTGRQAESRGMYKAPAMVAPTIDKVLTDPRTGTVTVSGRAKPSSQLSIGFPGGEHQSVRVSERGEYETQSKTRVPSGVISAQSYDEKKNASDKTTYDYVAPSAFLLTIIEVSTDDSSGRVTITGKTEPGANVAARYPDGQHATVSADDAGNYSVTSPAGVKASGDITLQASGKAGKGSETLTYVHTLPTASDGVAIVSAKADSDGRVTVVGTAAPGMTLNIAFPNGENLVVTAAEDGAYTATSARNVPSGDITVRAKEKSGGDGLTATHAYTDATAPAAPILTTVTTDGATGVVTITGTAEPGSTVTVTLPGGGSKTVPADSSTGVFTTLSDGALPSGKIKAISRDAAGNTSPEASKDYVDAVDKTAPVVTITAATADTGTGVVTVTGKTEAGASVTIRFPDGQRVSATAGTDGGYSAASPADVTASGNITAMAIDASGNRSPEVSKTYTDEVDKTAPEMVVITAAAADARGRVTVTGTAEPGSTVTVSFPGSESKTTTAGEDGGYVVTSERDVPSGDITAKATDKAGNASPVATHAYTDATLPAAPTITSVSAAAVSGVLTIMGTAEAGSDVTVTFPDASSKTIKADDEGIFTTTSTGNMPSGTIKVKSRDKAGNESPEITRAYADKTPPAITIATATTDASTGAVTVTGTTEADASVTIRFPDNQSVTVEAAADGSYRATSPADVTASGDIRAKATDAAGNVSSEATKAYADAVDKTAPAVVTITSATADAGGRVTVVGRAEPESMVTVVFPGGETKTADAGKDGSYTATSASNVPSGNITAKARDKAGNVGPAATHAYMDATAPATPTFSDVATHATTGVVTITGKAEPGSTVRVKLPGGDTKTVKADDVTGIFTVTSDDDEPGGMIKATSSDAAGNVSPEASKDYIDTVDKSAPPVVVITSASADTKGLVTVEGTADVGSTVTVGFPGGEVKTVTVGAGGSYTVKSTRNVPSGNITASAADKSGRSGPEVTLAYVDKTAPAMPRGISVETDSETGVVTFKGTAEPGSTVTVTLPGGEMKTVTADATSGGFTVVSDGDVGFGQYRVISRDAAGNSSGVYQDVYIDNVDKTPPVITITSVETRNDTGIVWVKGTTDPAASVTVTFPDGQSRTVTASSSGKYTVYSQKDVLSSGDIVAQARDQAGNTSDKVVQAYVDRVDVTAPAAPTITTMADDTAGRVTITGTAERGGDVTVSFPDGSSKVVKASDEGTYTVSSERVMPSGPIKVSVADAARNKSPEVKRDYVNNMIPTITSAVKNADGTRVTVKGRGKAGADVIVTFTDGRSKKVRVAGDGMFSVDSDGTIGSGDIIAVMLYSSGASSPEASYNYIDSAAPKPNITVMPGNLSMRPGLTSIRHIATINGANVGSTLAITAEPLASASATERAYVQKIIKAFDFDVQGGGSIGVRDLPAKHPGNAVPTGVYTFRVFVTDTETGGRANFLATVYYYS